MPLIERFTPGGNLYPDGSSTFAMLVTFFRRLAENLDKLHASINAAWQKGDEDQRTAWQQADEWQTAEWTNADVAALDTAKNDATSKANTAVGQARDQAVTEANAYTDTQVAAVQAGEVTAAGVDAGVNRAISDGRIDTTVQDSALADALGSSSSASSAAVAAAVDKRRNEKNALAYGYDPTGATTSHAAVQAAMDAAAAEGGGTVFVPDGELVLGASLKPRDNVRLYCNQGMVHVTATGNSHAFLVDQPIYGTFTVEGFVFEGTKADPGVHPSRGQDTIDNAPAGMRSGGWFVGSAAPNVAGQPVVQNLTYQDCVFLNMMQPLHYSGFSGHGLVTRCRFVNTLDPSFTYMGAAASLVYSHNMTLNGGDNGVSVSRGCRNVVISDNVFIGCAYYGVWAAGYVLNSTEGDAGPENFTVADNAIRNCGAGGICLGDAPRYGAVTGNTVHTVIRGPLDKPNNGEGVGIVITGFPHNGTVTRKAGHLTIAANTLYGCHRSGISIRDAEAVKITGNHIIDTGMPNYHDGNPISTTEQTYNTGVSSSAPATVSATVIDGNTVTETRASVVTNYAVAPNLAAATNARNNTAHRVRNALNEDVTVGAGRWKIGQHPTTGNVEMKRYDAAGTYQNTPWYVSATTGETTFNTNTVLAAGATLGNGQTFGIGTGTGGTIGYASSKIGFYGTTPVAKPSLTYSRASETTAEQQLRLALVALGLVNNHTTN